MATKLEFLNKDVLEAVIKREIDSNAEVLSFDKSFLPAGDNFNGEIMRLKINYRFTNSEKIETLSLITKYLPDDQFLIHFAEEMKSFKREMFMYKNTLADLYSFGYLKSIAPKPYLILKDPKPTLLLEDLCTLNYRMVPRRGGLDLEHCTFVLEKLACFHATSVALFEKDPNSMNMYDQALFADVYGAKDVLKKGFGELIQTCERLPELNKYVAKLKSFEKNWIEIVVESGKPDPIFNVLNHGDLWNNNMMFSYNADGSIKNVRFLDYQALHFSSPTLDLHVVLAAAANLEAKMSIIKLIEYYYQKLTFYLKKLKVKQKPPTWEDFLESYQSRTCYGIAAVVVLLAMSRSENRPDATISNFVNSEGPDGFRYHAFNNEIFVKDIKILFSIYAEFGAFR